MATVWYRKTPVQVASITGIAVVTASIIAFLPLVISIYFPKEMPKTMYTLGAIDGDINRYWSQLKYSFNREEYVNPLIVKELLGWISDPSSAVTTIDLVSGNKSNRFHGDYKEVKYGDRSYVESVGPDSEGGSFSYEYIGTSPSGIHLLICADNGGGSSTFYTVAMLTLKSDFCINQKIDGISDKRERVLLHLIGTITLGDRYDGKINFKDDLLTIGANSGTLPFHKDGIRAERIIEVK